MAIEALELSLHKELDLTPDDEKLNLCIRYLAQSRLDTQFSFTYNGIYGSQIRFLEQMRASNGVISSEIANNFYSDVKNRFPEFSQVTSDQYFGYLAQRRLINISKEKMELTFEGVDFLLFIFRYSLSKERLY